MSCLYRLDDSVSGSESAEATCIPHPYSLLLSARCRRLARNIHEQLGQWPWDVMPDNKPERWTTNMLERFADVAAYVNGSFTVRDLVTRLEEAIRARLPDNDWGTSGIDLHVVDFENTLRSLAQDNISQVSDSSAGSQIFEDVVIGLEQPSKYGYARNRAYGGSAPVSSISSWTSNASISGTSYSGSEAETITQVSCKRNTPEDLLGPLFSQLSSLQNFLEPYMPKQIGSFQTKRHLLTDFIDRAQANVPDIQLHVLSVKRRAEKQETQLREVNNRLAIISSWLDKKTDEIQSARNTCQRLTDECQGLEKLVDALEKPIRDAESPTAEQTSASGEYRERHKARWAEANSLFRFLQETQQDVNHGYLQKEREQRSKTRLEGSIETLKEDVKKQESELEMLDQVKRLVKCHENGYSPDYLDELADLLILSKGPGQ